MRKEYNAIEVTDVNYMMGCTYTIWATTSICIRSILDRRAKAMDPIQAITILAKHILRVIYMQDQYLEKSMRGIEWNGVGQV